MHLHESKTCRYKQFALLQLNTSLGRGVEVKLDAGDGKGKGVFTTRDYAQGDAVFIERPLVSLVVARRLSSSSS